MALLIFFFVGGQTLLKLDVETCVRLFLRKKKIKKLLNLMPIVELEYEEKSRFLEHFFFRTCSFPTPRQALMTL